MAGISLRSVAKSFGSVDVIPGLSLDIDSGEFIVFLGPSGCGKTTLLRMIAGLEEVSDGEIHIGARRVDQLQPGQRGVAMVFQHYALYPHMSVRENMAFGLRNISTPEPEIAAKIAAAARTLEIEHLLDRKPTALSGGQRQRVAIGRAIVKQPDAFLFDEPLSNLDAALRGRTRVELARLHRQLGATMIFVTHDQVEAMTLASRIVVMKGGQIEQIGTPKEVYKRPATRFVASFVGSPPMTILPASRKPDEDGRVCVQMPDGSFVRTDILASAIPAGDLELGFRAEDISIGGDIPANADVVEYLGERTLVHARLRDGTVVVHDVGPDSKFAVGDTLTLKIQPAKVHLFDASGRAYHAD